MSPIAPRVRDIVAAAICALFAAPSNAIIVVDPADYIERPPNAVIARLNNGTCVPIGARFALTADHVFASESQFVYYKGQYFGIQAVYRHPEAPAIDLKVIELRPQHRFDQWVELHPDPNTVPIGSPVVIGGWGYTAGDPDGSCFEWGPREERWATNRLSGHVAGRWSFYRFDTELPYEGIAANYDSGSFLGISPDGCDMFLLGIATSASSGSTPPTCDNDTAHYVQVDNEWLEPFTGPTCRGDVDADGDTDVYDYFAFVQAFNGDSKGSDCGTRTNGDLNHDGNIDLNDFNILISDFGCFD